jgi:NADH dehydrogenase FAD-containing subunit
MESGDETRKKQKKRSAPASRFKIDFSFRREVFFIIAGALAGALTYVIPITIFAIEEGSSYYFTWIVFGHIAGVYSPVDSVIIAGFMLHILTATSIGIVAGLFLYKTNILNISKPSNGLKYGLFVGTLVFAIFAIPVQEFVLGPEFARTSAASSDKETTSTPSAAINTSPSSATENSQPMISEPSLSSTNGVLLVINQLRTLANSLIINLVFGITLGLFSSLLSIKFGARYRCPQCDISFSRVDSLQRHLELIHGTEPILSKKVLILGGGFAGVVILRRLQSRFQNDVSVDITMVSKDNFFLFTPMLHEVASGMIETRHIVTPIRAFCNRAKFYAAKLEYIDLNNKTIVIESPIATLSKKVSYGEVDSTTEEEDEDESKAILLAKSQIVRLSYDYLVIAIGSETKFFDMPDIEKYAFTIKSWNDAIVIRNHIIHQLEQAEVLLHQQLEPPSGDNYNNTNGKYLDLYQKDEKERLLTFVIVGRGFAGVETAGELNDFLRDSVEDYYHNIESKDIRVILIQSGKRLLPEMGKELAKFAMQKLIQGGVEVILEVRVTGVTKNSVKIKVEERYLQTV